MNTATWNKNSHGLFDYEEIKIEQKTLFTHEEKYLIRDSNALGGIDLINEDELSIRSMPKEDVLFKIIPDKDNTQNFTIESCSKTGICEEVIDKLWLITKSLKRNGKKEVIKKLSIGLQITPRGDSKIRTYSTQSKRLPY